MMYSVKALTQLEPIDGFRFNMSVEPLDILRLSATWNYSIIGSRRYFDACGTLFNFSQGEPSFNNYFLTAELSGLRGFTAIGSHMVSPGLGILIKGESTIPDLKSIKKARYMIEMRKILGPGHIGLFKKENSFGLHYLHRLNPSFSYGCQLELTVSLPKY